MRNNISPLKEDGSPGGYQGRGLRPRSSPGSTGPRLCPRPAGPHLQSRFAEAIQGVGVHQLAVQKAAHLLHVAPGRGPTQSVANADLLKQHVETGGLRSPRTHRSPVSAGKPAVAGPNSPFRARPRCARPTLDSWPGSPVQGSRETPALAAGSSPCQPGGRRGAGNPAQPSAAGRALPGARPLGAGSPRNSPSLLHDGRGSSEPTRPPLRQNQTPGGGVRALAAPPPNTANLFSYKLATQ